MPDELFNRRRVTWHRVVAFISAFIAASVGVTSSHLRAQVVDLARHEVRQRDGGPQPPPPSTAPPAPPQQNHADHDSCDNDDQHLNGEELTIAAMIAGTIVTGPFTLPPILLGDTYDHAGRFPDYPYQHDIPGSMFIDRACQNPGKPWQTSVSLEAGDVSDTLDRFAGRLEVGTTCRLDLDSEWNYFTEQTSFGPDELHVGDVNLVVRFAQTEQIQFRSGLGVNWLADDAGADAGFNFTYGFDAFPARPWVFTAVVDWGTLGHAPLLHGRATAGVQLHRCEIFAGYDYRSIGKADFDGPIAGLTVSF
jgi:hypothetical protein